MRESVAHVKRPRRRIAPAPGPGPQEVTPWTDDRPDREHLAAVEVDLILSAWIAELPEGDLADTFRVCVARIDVHARDMFGEAWTKPRLRHLFDDTQTALCLADDVYPMPMGVVADPCQLCDHIEAEIARMERIR